MTSSALHYIMEVTGGEKVSNIKDSRAKYFKERRETRKHFNVLIDRTLVEAIEEKLKKENRTKANWLIEKILEETNK